MNKHDGGGGAYWWRRGLLGLISGGRGLLIINGWEGLIDGGEGLIDG